jgi:hypothetical protein
MEQLGPTSARIAGTISCQRLVQARSFAIEITDNGLNPPNQDGYHVTLFDASGNAVYDWADLTTLRRGDLLVQFV